MPRQDPGEPYFRVDSNEARSILDGDPENTVVVDVRRDDEWVTGHVTGAIHIPIDDLVDRMGEVPQDRKLLFICAAGVRSGLACEMAAAMGYATETFSTSRMGLPTGLRGITPHPTGTTLNRANSSIRPGKPLETCKEI